MPDDLFAGSGSRPSSSKFKDDHLLLYAAWVHALNAGTPIHRLALFAYIQTHLLAASEEQFQNVIQNSKYWQRVSSALYTLTELGQAEMIRIFGSLPTFFLSGEALYTFFFQYRNHCIAVEVSTITGKTQVTLDGINMKGTKAASALRHYGINLEIQGSSAPRKILDWILRQDFQWTRVQ